MNIQEIFDTAVKGVLGQGAICMNDSSCALRGKNNTKCAVGWLIDDDDYDSGMEGFSSLSEIDWERAKPARRKDFNGDKFFAMMIKSIEKTTGRLDEVKWNLLVDLQAAHDAGYDVASSDVNFEGTDERFENVAHEYGLSKKVIEDWRKTQPATTVV